jgi:hypothetical protein
MSSRMHERDMGGCCGLSHPPGPFGKGRARNLFRLERTADIYDMSSFTDNSPMSRSDYDESRMNWLCEYNLSFSLYR